MPGSASAPSVCSRAGALGASTVRDEWFPRHGGFCVEMAHSPPRRLGLSPPPLTSPPCRQVPGMDGRRAPGLGASLQPAVTPHAPSIASARVLRTVRASMAVSPPRRCSRGLAPSSVFLTRLKLTLAVLVAGSRRVEAWRNTPSSPLFSPLLSCSLTNPCPNTPPLLPNPPYRSRRLSSPMKVASRRGCGARGTTERRRHRLGRRCCRLLIPPCHTRLKPSLFLDPFTTRAT